MTAETAGVSAPNRGLLARLFGRFRLAYLPVLAVYFSFGASALTGVATVYLQKDTLHLTPAEVAGIGFWLGLPWSMKMVAGVASDRYPILGSRRSAYLLLGAVCTLAGYALTATVVSTKGHYLLAMLLVTVGYMIQDVVADALSVELAQDDEELGQIQALGRMALLAGGISVAYLGGWLAAHIGTREVFGVAVILPFLVVLTLPILHRVPRRPPPPAEGGPLGGGRAGLVLAVGLGYAALGIALNLQDVPYSQEIVLAVSLALVGFLLKRMGVTRAVLVAAGVIFLFRAMPGVGQGYSYWAIDQLGFDQKFLGLLGQASAVFGLVGLLVFRKAIVSRPVSFTLFWVVIAGSILSLPSIGLFYGIHEWLGVSARTFAFIDTTISAPLSQLTMVPMLILIAKSAPRGAEATMFAIMASWMNLALSASELFTQYANDAFQVTQQDYSNLGLLMIAVTLIGLLPLAAIPLLRRYEQKLHHE
ncbi:MAG TPA: MFS transporter [Burkholderiales bacterium]|nr:MFS transporter [Burkholderiales bacterium]